MAAANSAQAAAPSRPSASPPRSVVDRVATPLSLFLDSPSSRRPPPPPPAFARDDLLASMSPAETPEPAVSPPSPPPQPDADADADAFGPAREPRQPPTAPRPAAHPGAARRSEPPFCDPAAPKAMAPSPPGSNPDSPPLCDRPLRTASVRADTKLAQPTPIPRASQPAGDLKMGSGSPFGNIAQLEATAERLSMTSSIDDAIRDLHGELKRTDSRRSSILAANLRASAADAPAHDHHLDEAAAAVDQLRHHLSATSSIVSTNTAARNGGYSPAAFVMSPTHSLSGRLRSSSKGAMGRSDLDLDPLLSRHGPGKTSDRSARSGKMSLAEISESEPIALTQAALDEADVAPPIEELMEERTLRLTGHDHNRLDNGASHDMYEAGAHAEVPLPLRIGARRMADDASRHAADAARHAADAARPADDAARPADDDDTRCTSSHSNNTFQQCRDAFVDFDGVHWESEHEQDPAALLQTEQDLATPRGPPPAASQDFPNPNLAPGSDMQYYPARVPAMLNVPPKLSSKIKTTERNQRQSKVLSVMMDSNGQLASPEAPWQSASPDRSRVAEATQHSWLPDPVAGHRGSFNLLTPPSPTKSQGTASNRGDERLSTPAELEAEAPADDLRAPPRMSSLHPDKRKSRASFLAKLPPQLRASAFFDLPSVTADVEMKDGSAMATLDSILDASATAPVGVFTGKLGSETHAKKKNKSRKSAATLGALSPGSEPEPRPKKRSSLMWLRRRTSSNNAEEKRPGSMASAPVLGADAGEREDHKLMDGDGDHSDHDEAESEGDESEAESEGYFGPPTTLLAELQLRKREQQQRKKNMATGFPNGIHATLLEMDTVAETQRKNRQSKRVNLAWEDPGAHADQNGSEDEDVPLAILAAMHHGAKNKADLERPMGLMERRALEDNEPLSHRRARLQGLDTLPLALQKRQSVMSFPALGAGEARSPHPAVSPAPGPDEDEGEHETLGARRRRLVAPDGNSAQTPEDRPISSSFSAELLSQFGAVDKAEAKPGDDKAAAAPDTAGEETLGQRRRRLQAEREAREREMSHGNNPTAGAAQKISRRISMADVLAAHPKKDIDARAREGEVRRVDESRAVAEREARMAAMRKQMPQSLAQPNVERSGGFRGGAYNDGSGGCGPQVSRNSAVFTPQGLTQGPYGYGNYNRSSVLLNNYKGAAPPPAYGAMGSSTHLGGYDGLHHPAGLFNANAAMGVYGAGLVAPVAVNGGSMDRVERWRRGVHP